MTAPLGPLFYLPYAMVEDASGVPFPGALLNFYLTGSSTPTPTYTDPGLTTPNTNPVVANAGGTFPEIFLDPTVTYKVVLTDSFGNEIWTADPVLQAWFQANAIYVDIPFEFLGGTPPITLELMGAYRFLRACTFPSNFAGSSGNCAAPPTTGNFTITIKQNGTAIGTITVTETTGVFAFATIGGAAPSFAADDDLTFVAQAGLDASFANAWWTLTGTVAG